MLPQGLLCRALPTVPSRTRLVATNMRRLGSSIPTNRLVFRFISNATTLPPSVFRSTLPIVPSRTSVTTADTRRPTTPAVSELSSSPIVRRSVSSSERTDTVTVKVERRFRPTKESMQCLRTNNGSPSFETLQHLDTKDYEDFYYDIDQDVWVMECIAPDFYFPNFGRKPIYKSLMARGIRIRKRNGKLQGRIRCGGTIQHPGSVVLEGDEEVHQYLETVLKPPARFDKLQEVLHMDRKREVWNVGEYKIAYDEVRGRWVADYDDNGNKIVNCRAERPGFSDYFNDPENPIRLGRVELLEVVNAGKEKETWKRLNKKIKHFMKMHDWAFPTA